MPKYFCKNCYNFKTRLIKKEHIGNFSKYKIRKAIRTQDIPSLDFAFPFNLTVYKRVMRYGECGIVYCTKNLLTRDLYIDRGNAAQISCGKEPCPEYIPVHLKNSGSIA